jgi:anti-sigma-K factor RskA
MTSKHDPDDGAMLAAEYALGLLSGDDLADARRRVSEERAFADIVTEWEVRLAALADELAPERPSSAAKAALIATLFPPTARPPFWQRLWVWRAVSVTSLLALATFVVIDVWDAPRGPLYAAEITSESGDFRVVAVVDKATDEVTLSRTEGAAPEGRILQVWAHGPGEPAISVGLWPGGETVRLRLPPAIAEVEGVLTLGVSEEPPGGSPTGSPSGRVIGTVDVPGVSAAS